MQLQSFDSSLIRAVQTQSGYYSSWPQDKCFSYNGVIYAFYNKGSAAGSNDLAVYMRTSSDNGLTWSAETTVYSQGTTYSGGCTAWGGGVDSSGNFWMIVRQGGGVDFKIADCSHILIKSTNQGSTWTTVGTVAFNDGTYVPVLYSSFAQLGDGSLAWGYHFTSGQVGIIKTTDGGTTWSNVNMYTAAQNAGPTLVEPTLHYDAANSVTVGFLRTQAHATQPIMFWKSTDNCATFTIYPTSMQVDMATCPITDSYDGNYYYAMCCERYTYVGNGARVWIMYAKKSDAIAHGWQAFTVEQVGVLDAVATVGTNSGTGQPSVAKGTNSLIWFVSNEAVLGNPMIYCFMSDPNLASLVGVSSLNAPTGTKVGLHSLTSGIGDPRLRMQGPTGWGCLKTCPLNASTALDGIELQTETGAIALST